MARRTRAAGIESPAELARKLAILEDELARQRAAIERLTDVPRPPADRGPNEPRATPPLRPALQTLRP